MLSITFSDDSDRTKGEWKHCANDAAGRLVCSSVCAIASASSAAPCSIFLSRAISLRQPALISSSTGPRRSRPAGRPAGQPLVRSLSRENFNSGESRFFWPSVHIFYCRPLLSGKMLSADYIQKPRSAQRVLSHTQHKRRSISLRRERATLRADANIIMREGLLCPDAHNKIKSQSPQPGRKKNFPLRFYLLWILWCALDWPQRIWPLFIINQPRL